MELNTWRESKAFGGERTLKKLEIEAFLTFRYDPISGGGGLELFFRGPWTLTVGFEASDFISFQLWTSSAEISLEYSIFTLHNLTPE